MGFCTEPPPTFRQELKRADADVLIVYGTLSNPRLPANGFLEDGTTDLHIRSFLKNNGRLGAHTFLVLPRYCPGADNKKQPKYILFIDSRGRRLLPYRSFAIKSARSLSYFKGIVGLDAKDERKALRYFFCYLEDPDPVVATDAFLEFSRARYKHIRAVGKKLSPDRIAGWLKDPNTPPYRFGLYASLLGHCGTAKHAKLLRALIDNKARRVGMDDGHPGTEGMLVAYTMLKPREGWAYIRNVILAKPKTHFQLRYSALRAVRFFWETRPDLVKKKDLVDGLCLLLDQPDMADFAIEDLRKWKMWQVSDRVLALADRKSHDLPVIHRSLLRFALSLPSKPPRAVKFIQAARKQDKEYVDDVEEALKLETETSGK
jgi:hypothetical protein